MHIGSLSGKDRVQLSNVGINLCKRKLQLPILIVFVTNKRKGQNITTCIGKKKRQNITILIIFVTTVHTRSKYNYLGWSLQP